MLLCTSYKRVLSMFSVQTKINMQKVTLVVVVVVSVNIRQCFIGHNFRLFDGAAAGKENCSSEKSKAVKNKMQCFIYGKKKTKLCSVVHFRRCTFSLLLQVLLGLVSPACEYFCHLSVTRLDGGRLQSQRQLVSGASGEAADDRLPQLT